MSELIRGKLMLAANYRDADGGLIYRASQLGDPNLQRRERFL